MNLKIQGKALSANLKEVPLKFILEKLKRERGIWFQGDEALFNEQITVQFEGLSLEDSLKRILSSINYCLLFDQDRKLDGVVLIGKRKPGQAVAKGRAVRAGRSISSSTPKKHVTNSKAFKVAKNIPPPGGYAKATAKDLENFKAVKNSPPPGGAIEVSAEALQNFKVIKNCPSPGGPVTVTEEEIEKFKVKRNVPPPGGPVKPTPEELEKFKVKKNCPPPGS